MAGIQGSINNLLATVGIAAKLSPELEEARKVGQLEKHYEKLGAIQEESDFAENTVREITKEQKETAKEIAKVKPTEENVKRYTTEAEAYEAMSPENIAAEKELIKQQKALRSSFINWREIDPTRGGK